jgi:hypothetical protein
LGDWKENAACSEGRKDYGFGVAVIVSDRDIPGNAWFCRFNWRDRIVEPLDYGKESEMRKIDEKFSTTGDIVKSSNGEIVPEDEPLFLIRARDRLAVAALETYRELSQKDGCIDYHFEHLDKDIEAFKRFREEHPERMKQPSITRGK